MNRFLSFSRYSLDFEWSQLVVVSESVHFGTVLRTLSLLFWLFFLCSYGVAQESGSNCVTQNRVACESIRCSSLFAAALGTFEPLCNSTQQPWTPAQSKTQPVAHNPERAIAGVYTDRFILDTFFSLQSCVRLHNSYINILILIVFTRKGSWYTLYVLILRLTLRMRRWAVFPAKSSSFKV